MRVYTQNKNYTLYNGSMLDMPEVIAENSIDAVVTDPPYELNFMGKGWDNSGIAFQAETWRKCYEVLKPGAYMLAFGGTRTFHRIACAIEDAGFEIRDVIMWIYGSGFPKSLYIAKSIEAKLTTGSANTQEFKNLEGQKVTRGNYGFSSMMFQQGARPADYNNLDSDRLDRLTPKTEQAKQWDGWGTALKPAYEPVIVARKPCEGSITDNVLKYGVGGINIDECRIGAEERTYSGMSTKKPEGAGTFRDDNWVPKDDLEITVNGRFPANTILTYDDTDCDEVCGANADAVTRFFYCAKASKRDRDEGLEAFEDKILAFSNQAQAEAKRGNELKKGGMNDIKHRKNIHPTVKPTDLMQYLIRLVTPKGGTILDPFNGSGSTGKATMYENKDRNADYKYIGIELSEEYLQISKARIDFAAGEQTAEIVNFSELSQKAPKQMDIFDFLS